MMDGCFIVSLDFELLWGLAGWTEEQILKYKPRVEGAVNALRRILELFERYKIKCTICYVSGIQYKTIRDYLDASPTIKPAYCKELFSSYGLLLSLVSEGKIKEDLLFRPDVIEELKNNSMVELGSHTFSHYYAMEEGQTDIQFENDINTAKIENLKHGVNCVSIIFPRNQIPSKYKIICQKQGFTHIRGNEESFLYRSESTPSRFDYKRVLRLLDCYINITGHHTHIPLKNCQITDVKASRFLRPYNHYLRILEPLKLYRIKKDMLYAARKGEMYHLWWHPHNFGINTDRNIAQLEEICRWYAFMNETYGMKSSFMKEI